MIGTRLGAALAHDSQFLPPYCCHFQTCFLNTAVWTRNFTISIVQFSLKCSYCSSPFCLVLCICSSLKYENNNSVMLRNSVSFLPCYSHQHTQTYLSWDSLLVNVVSTKCYEFSSFAPLETVHLLKINISLVVVKIDSSPDILAVRICRPLGIHDKINIDMESRRLEILRQCDMAT